jgi:hypothetical protein
MPTQANADHNRRGSDGDSRRSGLGVVGCACCRDGVSAGRAGSGIEIAGRNCTATADQVTAVLLEPVIVAVNCCVPPVVSDAKVGEIVIATGAVTVTAGQAAAVLSTMLVAFAT